MEIESTEETVVVNVTTLESPSADSIIRQGLKIKKEQYSKRLDDRNEPWFRERIFAKRHIGYEKFRDLNYKHFLAKLLLDAEYGEIITIGSALEELWKIVGIVDWETFQNAFFTIHMYLTGELQLPEAVETVTSLALSPA